MSNTPPTGFAGIMNPPSDATTTTIGSVTTVVTSDLNTPSQGQIETTYALTERPKASWIWMKDSSGYPSISVTFVTISFWVTIILFILSSVEKIGPLTMRPFDVGGAAATLGSCLALYFGRRYTDAKYSVDKS